MGRNDLPTVTGYFVHPDGNTVPWESLTYEEKLDINKEWVRRWERVFPDAYRNYPEALAEIEEVSPEARERYYQIFPEKRNAAFGTGIPQTAK